jgi:lipopolysaccharide export system permease protein
MRLHDRYLFRELITPLAFCIGGFLVFGIPFFFKEKLGTIQEKNLSLPEAAGYCAASLPEYFVVILPILLLLALLYALTHHARYNEITALRAAGVSLWRVCLPYFAVGLLATGAYFALNEAAVPACDHWAARMLNRHTKPGDPAKNQPQPGINIFNARASRYWQFTEFKERGNLMVNPTVTWFPPDRSKHVLQAAQAVYTNGGWTFFDARLWTNSGPQTELAPAGQAAARRMPEFAETPQQIRVLLKFADTQTLHGSRNADIPLSELRELLRSAPDLRPEDARALATKFHGRLALPWTCFVAVLIAIPLGAQSGRRNLFLGVAGSIFVIFAYFVLQWVSLAMGMDGWLRPGWLAAWLPNLIFAAAGTALTLRLR